MRHYTYGEMPPRSVFMSKYREELGSGRYPVRWSDEDFTNMSELLDDYVGVPTSFSTSELYDLVRALVDEWNDDTPLSAWAGMIASSILFTLDIEWV